MYAISLETRGHNVQANRATIVTKPSRVCSTERQIRLHCVRVDHTRSHALIDMHIKLGIVGIALPRATNLRQSIENTHTVIACHSGCLITA